MKKNELIRNATRRGLLLCHGVALAAIVVGWSGTALAVNHAWSTNPPSALWNANNWTTNATVPGVANGKPVANDALFFGASTQLSLNNDYPVGTQFNGITFNNNAGSFTFGGNGIALAGNISVGTNITSQTINFDIVLTQAIARTVTVNSGPITLGGAISGQGGLTKAGIGTMTLSGSNTFNNPTMVNAGTLVLDYSTQDNSKLPNATRLTMAGSTLQLQDSGAGTHSEVVSAFTLDTGASSITQPAGSQSLSLSNITRNAGGTMDVPGDSVVLTLSGATNSILTASAGAYATVDGGADWAAKNGDNTSIVSYSSVGTYLATDATSLGGNGHSDVSSGIDTTLAGDTSGKTLRFNQNEARTITIAPAATLTLGVSTANAQGGGILVTPTVNPGSGTSTITGGTLKMGGNNAMQIHQYSPKGLTIGSVIADGGVGNDGVLTKTGSGTLTLAAANTYKGATYLNRGALALADQNALQNSTLTIQGGGPVSFASSAGTNFTVGGLAAASAGAGYNTGLTNSAGAAVALSVGGNNTSNTYAGVLSGAGGLTKTGTNVWTLSGANTFTGDVNVNAGRLLIGATTTCLGNPTVARNINVNNGGTLDFGAASDVLGIVSVLPVATLVVNSGGVVTNGSTSVITLGKVTLNGGTMVAGLGNNTGDAYRFKDTVTVGGSSPSYLLSIGTANSGYKFGATVTFNVADVTGNPASDLIVSGELKGTNGTQPQASGFIKAGVGTMELSNTNLNYVAPTTVSNGTLLVNGIMSTGAMTVASGGTLAGNGSIRGTGTVSGAVSPGSGGIGTLTTSNITWNAGVAWPYDLGLSASSDRLAINGTFTKGTGSGWAFDLQSVGSAGVYTLVTWSAATDFASGDFSANNLPGGLTPTFAVNANELTLTLAGGGPVGPTVGPVTLYRTSGQPLHILASALTTNSSDAGGGPVTSSWVSATSSNGYPVYISGPWVFYVPPANDNTTDYFNFRVANTNGVEAEATATVLVTSTTTNTVNVSNVSVAGNVASFTWSGLPGRTNQVEGATALGPVPSANWSNIGQVVLSGMGIGSYAETNPPTPRFYRILDTVP